VSAAEVSAAQAQSDYVRFQDLQRQGFISAAELQRRQTAWQAAQAQLAQARAQAAVQGNQAGYSRLLAPGDGVVTAVAAEPGMVLAAGTPVLRLAESGARDAVFAVPEQAVAGVRKLTGRAGAVQVSLWGRDGTLPATVREVAAAADPVTRTFQVKADLGAAAVELGRSASVAVTQPVRAGVLRLPLTALFERDGRTVVWLLDGRTMTVRAVPVEVSGSEGDAVLVAATLPPGAEVVTAGVHVLTEGEKVTRWAATASAG
jgi:RND family efflux transporter MFP subunit